MVTSALSCNRTGVIRTPRLVIFSQRYALDLNLPPPEQNTRPLIYAQGTHRHASQLAENIA
jgi:hypothetical protein